ncbi:uncharacterized protein LOC142999048 [Genypterus blacodes]|uniref:uncharacterized protein LOC142999048 n=1 Tax=Genypterus blacodes TaxID=154954 RepID=UPI003F7757FC
MTAAGLSRTGGSASGSVSSFCPLSPRAQRRKQQEMRAAQQKHVLEVGRREEAERRRVRPCQLSIQVGKSSVRSVPRLKVSPRQSSKPCSRLSNSRQPRKGPQSKTQGTSNQHLPRQSNHQLPCNHHLPRNHQAVSNKHSNPSTLSTLQKSGRHSSRTPSQIPLNTGSIIRQLSGQPGVLRLSRRRRGLPPDTSPVSTNQVPVDGTSKNYRTLQCYDGDVPLGSKCEVSQKEANCEEEVRSYVSNMSQITGDKMNHEREHRQGRGSQVSKMRGERDSPVSEAIHDEVKNVVELSDGRLSYSNSISRVGEVIFRPVRGKMVKRTQPTSSRISKMVNRPMVDHAVPRVMTARTTTKAAINSIASLYIDTELPARISAKHTAKGVHKDSPASSYSVHKSNVAAKDSFKGIPVDKTKNNAPVIHYFHTSKGSAKALTQMKPITSAIKTRSSPRNLHKH